MDCLCVSLWDPSRFSAKPFCQRVSPTGWFKCLLMGPVLFLGETLQPNSVVRRMVYISPYGKSIVSGRNIFAAGCHQQDGLCVPSWCQSCLSAQRVCQRVSAAEWVIASVWCPFCCSATKDSLARVRAEREMTKKQNAALSCRVCMRMRRRVKLHLAAPCQPPDIRFLKCSGVVGV